MFAAPPNQSLEWSDSGVEGSSRFLRKLWRVVTGYGQSTASSQLPDQAQLDSEQKQLRYKTHTTLEKVSDDYGRRQTFNTAIAAIMELVNSITRFQDDRADKLNEQDNAVIGEALQIVLLGLSPVVPHFCHALWASIGKSGAIIDEPWPTVDQAALVQDEIQVVIQVNGKLRGKLTVARDTGKDKLEALAMADDNVQRHIADKTVRKVIVVPGKLINIVVG